MPASGCCPSHTVCPRPRAMRSSSCRPSRPMLSRRWRGSNGSSSRSRRHLPRRRHCCRYLPSRTRLHRPARRRLGRRSQGRLGSRRRPAPRHPSCPHSSSRSRSLDALARPPAPPMLRALARTERRVMLPPAAAAGRGAAPRALMRMRPCPQSLKAWPRRTSGSSSSSKRSRGLRRRSPPPIPSQMGRSCKLTL